MVLSCAALLCMQCYKMCMNSYMVVTRKQNWKATSYGVWSINCFLSLEFGTSIVFFSFEFGSRMFPVSFELEAFVSGSWELRIRSFCSCEFGNQTHIISTFPRLGVLSSGPIDIMNHVCVNSSFQSCQSRAYAYPIRQWCPHRILWRAHVFHCE